MFTPKQVADSLNLSSTTIRNYSRLWADHLSPSANPQAGQGRIYTEDDLAVMATIAALRDSQATTDQIRAALDAGQRLEPVRPLQEEPPAGDADQAATGQAAAAAAAAASTAIEIYRDRVNVLERRADQLADRLIEAEKRAAAAESAIEVNRDRVSQLEARAGQLADQARADQARADQLAAQAAADAARAAAAERELEVLRQLYEAATSPTPTSARPTFWQWLTGRK